MFVDVRGCRLYFDVDGAALVPDGPRMREKPTLLLLHGGPGFDHSGFKPRFSRLARHCQLVFLDHRGQGRSERSDPSQWRLDVWADDVRHACDALGIERPFVLGQSFGGMVAMVYAARHPGHAARIVLSSTSARMHLDERVLPEFERLGGAEVRAAAEALLKHPGDENLSTFVERCLPVYNTTPQDPDGGARNVMRTEVLYHFFAGEARSMNLLPGLSKVTSPTLVISSSEDPITPAADARDIVAALPEALVRHEHYEEAGHGVYRDRPEDYFALLEDFLELGDGPPNA